SSGRRFQMPSVGDSALRAQAIDLISSETELFENFVIVLTKFWGTARRHLRSAMHGERAAHGELQMFAGAFERDDHVVREQLRIGRYFSWTSDDAGSDVSLVESMLPVVHGL